MLEVCECGYLKEPNHKCYTPAEQEYVNKLIAAAAEYDELYGGEGMEERAAINRTYQGR